MSYQKILYSLYIIIFILLISLLEGDEIISLISGDHQKLTAPILLNTKNLGLNLWLPKIEGLKSEFPQITAKAAFFIETKTGKVLYAKNPHQKLPIASLVKVMTATIALENYNLEDRFKVSLKASEMEPDKMSLIQGEKLTLKELLYGIFLISANDAAEVLAEGLVNDGMGDENRKISRDQFIKSMNIKAEQLGMRDSHFVNPTGFDEDDNNSYSTAYDLAILTRYAVRQLPTLIDISRTDHIQIPETSEHQDYDMYSGINLLTTYPGVVGFKTGYTPLAGLTLITLAQKDGYEIIGVLLGSENRRDEARELLDYSFAQLSD